VLTSRRNFLALAAAAAATPAACAAAGRPNILVFMTDQETALLPGPVETPNRRRIEAHGVRFTNAFCNTPQCSAARSALLTGREPHETGVLTNVDGESLGKALRPDMPNLGSVLRAAGYGTGYFGKWHLGNEDGDLHAYGFDTYAPGKDDVAAGKAAEWIAAQKGPWLAWVSVLNPHNIYNLEAVRKTAPRKGVTAPASDLGNLKDKPSEQQGYVDQDQGKLTRTFSREDWLRYRSRYCELVEQADRSLGMVLGAVKDWDSTAIVYTADHGDALGEHGLPFKGPFMYEPLIRIPLVISAPWKWKAGERRNMTVQADLAPTLVGLAGVEWPGKVTGINLHPGVSNRDAVFLEYYAKQKWVNPIRTIRTTRWKLNWYDSGHQELYDLAADPNEFRNLAGDAGSVEVRRHLEWRLNGWRPAIGSRA
jgi:arylsulfatase A-like enzyme